MKTIQNMLSIALCAILLAGVLTGCAQSNLRSVTTVKVKSADILATTDYSGAVHAATSMAVIPNVSGKVAAVNVALGQTVRAGDVLMTLDTADADLALRQAQASFENARANYEKVSQAGSKQAETQARQSLTAAENELRDARTNYELIKSQYDSGASVAPAQAAYDSAKGEVDRITFFVSIGEESEYSLQNAQSALSTAAAQLENAKASAQTAINSADSRLQNAQSALNTAQENYNLTVSSVNPGNIKAAKAGMESAEVSVEVAQKRLDDCTVRSPIDGTVGAVYVKAGDMTGQQSEAFHILGIQTGMNLEASVTESAAAKLTAGMTATVTLTGTSETREATVSEIAPMADAKTGLYLVKVLLSDAQELKDGMLATVNFSGNGNGSVLVPQKSLLVQEGKRFVYVVQEGRAVHTEVGAGTVQGAYVAVVGLDVGTEVILQGADQVTEGEVVRVVSGANG